MVPPAVEPAVAVEINQIDEELAANATTEAARVPALRTGARRHHHHVSARHRLATLGLDFKTNHLHSHLHSVFIVLFHRFISVC